LIKRDTHYINRQTLGKTSEHFFAVSTKLLLENKIHNNYFYEHTLVPTVGFLVPWCIYHIAIKNTLSWVASDEAVGT